MSMSEVVPKLLIFTLEGSSSEDLRALDFLVGRFGTASLREDGLFLWAIFPFGVAEDETWPLALGCTADVGLRLGLKACAKVRGTLIQVSLCSPQHELAETFPYAQPCT